MHGQQNMKFRTVGVAVLNVIGGKDRLDLDFFFFKTHVKCKIKKLK